MNTNYIIYIIDLYFIIGLIFTGREMLSKSFNEEARKYFNKWGFPKFVNNIILLIGGLYTTIIWPCGVLFYVKQAIKNRKK